MANGVITKIRKEAIRNLPTILTIMGGVGTVAAVGMSSHSAIKAKQVLEEAGDDISKADKALIYIKEYAPVALMTTASLVCIFGSNHVHKQRFAGLAGMYILREASTKEYKDKVEEILGAKKAQQIKDDILQNKVITNPPNEKNTYVPILPESIEGLSLWYDEMTGRYFYSSAERIRRAELDATKMLHKNGFVTMNDVYELLETIPTMQIGDDFVWSIKNGDDEVVIEIGSTLTDSQKPCGTISMFPRPNSAWLGEV